MSARPRLAWLALLPACAAARGHAVAPEAVAVCSQARAAPATVLDDATVARVELRGLRYVRGAELCARLRTVAGKAIDRGALQADVVALWRSGQLDDVVIERHVDGGVVSVVVRVRELARVTDVRVVGEGLSLAQRDAAHDTLAVRTGDPAEPLALQRRAEALRDSLVEQGLRSVKVAASTQPFRDGVLVLFRVSGARRAVVKAFAVSGNARLSSDDVKALLPSVRLGAVLNDDALRADLLRLNARYYDLGMVNSSVDEPRVDEDDGGGLTVRLVVRESPVFHLGKVGFAGKLAAPEADYQAAFAIAPGAVFSRAAVVEARQRLQALHAQRGGRGAPEPETSVDADAARVDLVWRFDP